MVKGNRYSSEVRKRAVRLVFEHENEYESPWAASQPEGDALDNLWIEHG